MYFYSEEYQTPNKVFEGMQGKDWRRIKFSELRRRNSEMSSVSITILGDLRIRAFRVAWICEELSLPWIEGNAQEELLKDYYDRVRQRTAYKKCWKMQSK